MGFLSNLYLDILLNFRDNKFLYQVAGYTAPKAQEAPAPARNDKDLNDMTTEELRAFIQDGERELANRAKDVTAPQGIDDML